jgi:DNA-cytosine methyltransferase
MALGDKIKTYYASEIDPYAIKIAKKNHPDTIHLGDVRTITSASLPKIDLLIGGSPCQDLSIAKHNRKGLDGERSGLFWEYVRIKKELNPAYFILENVASMSKEAKQTISEAVGVQPVLIDASLVSAQSRKRLFWTNIPVVGLPEDRGILLKDILQPDGEVDERMTTKVKVFYPENLVKKNRTLVRVGHIGNTESQANRVYDIVGKSVPLSANGGGLGAKTGLYQLDQKIRKLTPIECERLQSLPDNYTEGVSNTQRYKCLGNAFNVEVIKFILSFIPPL